MLSGTEMGDRLRAIIADCKGKIPDLRHWEEASAQHMRHIWLSDCESLVSHLKNPRNEKLENTRLSIDIQGLKQMLWETQDGTSLDELLPESTCENAVRWIDTSCMIVDSLTKKMDPSVLLKVMKDGVINLQATVDSEMKKLKKQKARRAKKDAEKENEHQSQGFIALLSYVDRKLQEKTAQTDQAIDGSQQVTGVRTVQEIDRSSMATTMDTDKKPEQNISDDKADQNIRHAVRELMS